MGHWNLLVGHGVIRGSVVRHPWLMTSLVNRFFSSLMPSNQRTNFCNIVTKVKKIAKAVGFPGNFVYKTLKALS